MEFERYDDGVPSWVDLGSTDLAKSREFYGGLFGWNCPEGPPEAGGYSVCDLGGKTVAGLGPQMNPAMPPVWMTYVNVDDADDTVAKVAANGGTVFMPPMDVMEAGRMAVFADPVGAVIGLWQPKQHTGAQVVNEPGTLLLERAHHDGPRRRRRPSTRRCSAGTPRTRALPAARRPTPSGSSPGRSVGGMMRSRPRCRRRCRRTGASTSPWPTPTPPWPRPRSSGPAASWARPTLSLAGSPCSPTTSGAVFNVLQLKG